MAKNIESAQNGLGDSTTPPSLSIAVPTLRDIEPLNEQWDCVKLPTDVLLLTVKDVEFLSCYAYLDNITKSYHVALGAVYFGEMGDEGREKVRVSLVRCYGGTYQSHPQDVVRNAVPLLRPKAVIAVGFCGGLTRKKTKLGDVVISVKLANDLVMANVSKNMAALIRYAADGWKAPLEKPEALKVDVHLDTAMLVNSDVRRNELLRKYPDAIAIEMECEGIYTVKR